MVAGTVIGLTGEAEHLRGCGLAALVLSARGAEEAARGFTTET